MEANGAVELRWRERLHPVYAVSVSVFVAVLLSIALRKGQFQPVHRVTMFTVAVGLGYSLVAQLVNATRLYREGGALRIVHGPLPWRAALEVPVEAVASLGCDRHSKRLLLRTKLGEEVVLGENLPGERLADLDDRLREVLALPSLRSSLR